VQLNLLEHTEEKLVGISPSYYVILVVDIERFGERLNPVEQWLRTRLYAIMEEAMAAAGISVSGVPYSDRGDGAFWLLPGSTSKVDLTGRFIRELQDRLREHGRLSSTEAALRLRVALHAGEIGKDDRGWVGQDLNTACRLVDLQLLRDALAAAPDAGLVLAVTNDWYSSVVRHGYPGVAAAEFADVPFIAKEVEQRAWISVPGYSRPPGIEGKQDPGSSRAADDLARDSAGPDPGGASPAGAPSDGSVAPTSGPAAASTAQTWNSGPFAGANVHAQQVYAGDHYETNTRGTGCD
jgi:hypothetical protein